MPIADVSLQNRRSLCERASLYLSLSITYLEACILTKSIHRRKTRCFLLVLKSKIVSKLEREKNVTKQIDRKYHDN